MTTSNKRRTNKKNAVKKNIKNQPESPLLNRFENQTIWHIALLILLPFFLYIKTVGYLLINFDDVDIIVNNLDFLNSLKNLGEAFKRDVFMSAQGDFYRPLQTVTFMLDTIIGGGKPWIYHFSNLIYHILTVVSLYYLLRLLKVKNLSALFATLVFSIHPLLSSAVSWVPARGDILFGMSGILMFITFIKYTSTRKPVFLILNFIVTFLAVFCKEMAVLLPILLLYFYFPVLNHKLNKENIKQLFPLLILWVGVFIVFFILRSKVVTGTTAALIFGIQPFISNLAAIPTIIFKFIFPLELSTMPLYNPIFTFSGCFILIIAVWLTIKAIKQKDWINVMGVFWFMLFIIPPLFYRLQNSRFILEYYENQSYLPIMGLILILSLFVQRLKIKKSFQQIFAVSILVIYTFLASTHSDNFKDSLVFFNNATERGNPGACTKRGELYMDQRDFPNAVKDFNLSIKLSNEAYAPAFFNRGVYYSQATKDYIAAEADFTKAIQLDPSLINAYIQRASERVFRNNFGGAIEDLDVAKSIDSTRVDVYYTKAKVLTSAMSFGDAIPLYNKAISMFAFSPEIYNDRAYARYRLKDYKGALKDCNKAISLMPDFMSAYYNKGIIYLEMGKPEIAIKELDTTLAITNNFYFGYFYRGMAKKQLNDMKGALEDWQESVRLGFTPAQDTINKYSK